MVGDQSRRGPEIHLGGIQPRNPVASAPSLKRYLRYLRHRSTAYPANAPLRPGLLTLELQGSVPVGPPSSRMARVFRLRQPFRPRTGRMSMFRCGTRHTPSDAASRRDAPVKGGGSGIGRLQRRQRAGLCLAGRRTGIRAGSPDRTGVYPGTTRSAMPFRANGPTLGIETEEPVSRCTRHGHVDMRQSAMVRLDCQTQGGGSEVACVSLAGRTIYPPPLRKFSICDELEHKGERNRDSYSG